MKLSALLALVPFAMGEQFVIPEIAEAVSMQMAEFHKYAAYHGPTGSASSKIAATPSMRVLVAEPSPKVAVTTTPYWYETIKHQGTSPFNHNSTYAVYRNVMSYGAKGDGVTDDTAAINRAMSDGGRCAPGKCASSSIYPAVVYFPAGTYVISSSIIDYYNTIILGNPNNLPVLRATPVFSGFGLIDGDQYQAGNVLGFGATNVFWRQVRNFVIDMTAVPASSSVTGIHWPTAQATSLQNIVFKMSSAPGTQHQGVFIEAGSGGFMSDLVMYGGLNGAVFGSQQFTVRNLTFNSAVTAISQLYDWGWTYSNINVNNCTYGLNMSGTNGNGLTTGSVTYFDSSFSNTKYAFLVGRTSSTQPPTAGSLTIENVALSNVGAAVTYGPWNATSRSTLLAGTTGSTTIAAWGSGNAYVPTGPIKFQGNFNKPPRPSALLSGSKWYSRSKPQYNTLSSSSFASVKSGGAKGDGVTDDTAAVQKVLTSAAAANQVVFFDAGQYKVTQTIVVPPNARIVGEAYSVILASGSFFQNINSPQVVVKVGNPGDTGSVEWSDMIVSTAGPAAGAILIQWNVAAPAGTPGGMWDVHARIGGVAGSNMQSSQCPAKAGSATVVPSCIGAYMSMHIAPSAAGVYLENVWLWTADHDVESPSLAQITVYTGRGLLVESKTGPTWLVGTAVEHHAQYQYQFSNTTNIYGGQMQTETPYYQPAPAANQPFPQNASLEDPSWSFYCPRGIVGPCAEAWGLRLLATTNTNIYGVGLYSFFSNYSTHCSDAGAGSDCQSAILTYDSAHTSNLFIYNLNTVGANSMINRDTTSLANYSANIDVYPSTIWFFASN